MGHRVAKADLLGGSLIGVLDLRKPLGPVRAGDESLRLRRGLLRIADHILINVHVMGPHSLAAKDPPLTVITAGESL